MEENNFKKELPLGMHFMNTIKSLLSQFIFIINVFNSKYVMSLSILIAPN